MNREEVRAAIGTTHEATAPRMVAGLSVHWHHDLSDIPAAAWDELVSPVEGGTPFLRHALLTTMADSGSACADTGWEARFLTVRGPDTETAPALWGACPVYLKHHSYGEYVFDWAWADAHDRAFAKHGQLYHPKLLSAVPFSPIPGQRLLVHPALSPDQAHAVRRAMLNALQEACASQGWSSAHLLFLSDDEASLAAGQGWLRRQGVQFHWEADSGWRSFADFLSSLTRDRRKKIQQERRKVADAGVTFEVRAGAQLRLDDWRFFGRCYTQTYLAHGQRPYLTPAFWDAIGTQQPEHWVMFIAHQGGERVAASLLAVDRAHGVAYGRYWGALAPISCLHFEACYYQPISWCIEHGIRRFEGGAQGEHKLHRGLLPVVTHSAHWISHPGLRDAIADFLRRETTGVDRYIDELADHCPFKPGDAGLSFGEKLAEQFAPPGDGHT